MLFERMVSDQEPGTVMIVIDCLERLPMQETRFSWRSPVQDPLYYIACHLSILSPKCRLHSVSARKYPKSLCFTFYLLTASRWRQSPSRQTIDGRKLWGLHRICLADGDSFAYRFQPQEAASSTGRPFDSKACTAYSSSPSQRHLGSIIMDLGWRTDDWGSAGCAWSVEIAQHLPYLSTDRACLR